MAYEMRAVACENQDPLLGGGAPSNGFYTPLSLREAFSIKVAVRILPDHSQPRTKACQARASYSLLQCLAMTIRWQLHKSASS